MTRLELWNGDICVLEVDAIVNPASPTLWMSTGVGGALKRAGGDAIEYAAVRQGPVAVGSAVVTEAGALAAEAVIHAVSLDSQHRTSGEAIAQAVRSALARGREIGATSIAFPALGTGIGGYPLDEAAEILVRTVREELGEADSIEHVIFALRGPATYEAFGRALARTAAVSANGVAPDAAAAPAASHTSAALALSAAPAALAEPVGVPVRRARGAKA
jgi:O-acetyl-ADP-ribose deacetylase (regulator of RNase III)